MSWYKDEDHIGYDLKGHKIIRKKRMDALDKLLDRNDSKKVRVIKMAYDCSSLIKQIPRLSFTHHVLMLITHVMLTSEERYICSN